MPRMLLIDIDHLRVALLLWAAAAHCLQTPTKHARAAPL